MLATLYFGLALMVFSSSVYGQDRGQALLKELENLQKSPNFGAVIPMLANTYRKST